MAQQEITPEIYEELEFSINDEDELVHLVHPIEKDLWWCGRKKTKENPRIPGCGAPDWDGTENGSDGSNITCVDCLHLFINPGADWWWRVNKAWYQR